MAPRRSTAASSDSEPDTPVRTTRSKSVKSSGSTRSARTLSPTNTPRRSTRIANDVHHAPTSPRRFHTSPKSATPQSLTVASKTSPHASHTNTSKTSLGLFKMSLCIPCSKERFVHSYIFLYHVLVFVLSTSALIFFWNTVFVEPLWRKSTAPGFSLMLETKTYHDWYHYLPRVWETMGMFVYYVVLLDAFQIAHVLFGWERTDIGPIFMHSFANNLYWGLLILFGNKEVYTHPACALIVYIYSLGRVVNHGYAVCHLLWPTVPSFICWANYNLFYVTYPLGAGSAMMLLNKLCDTYQPSTCNVKTFFMISYFVCPMIFSYLYETMKLKRAAHLSSIGRKPTRLF